MNAQQQNQNHLHLLQSLMLICLETTFTFILKNDRLARQHGKVFFLNRTCIEVNIYLPSMRFYVSFDQRGVFFDLEKPENTIDADIILTAPAFDLLNILLTGNRKAIRNIDLKQQVDLHKDLRLLLESLSVPTLVADWRYWLSAGNEKTKLPKHSILSLSKHIEQQRNEITQLQIKLKSSRYDLKQLQRKYKIIFFANITLVLLLIVCVALIICYYP